MGQCQKLYSGQMLSLKLIYFSTTNPPQLSPKKRISSPCKRPHIEVAKPRDSILAYNHQHADLTTSYPPQLLITALTNSIQICKSKVMLPNSRISNLLQVMEHLLYNLLNNILKSLSWRANPLYHALVKNAYYKIFLPLLIPAVTLCKDT